MKVKRYVVDSMPDALQKIRSELGKDAVIINTKEIRVGGIMGLFTKKKIEVIAATDTAPQTAEPAGAMRRNTGSAVPAASAAAQPPRPEPVSASVPGTAPATARTAARTVVPPLQPNVPASLFTQATNDRDPQLPHAPVQQYHSAGTAPERTGHPPVTRAARPLTAHEDTLLEEMRQMKEMMRKLAVGERALDPDPSLFIPKSLLQLKEQLLEQEVRPDIAQSLIEAAAAKGEAEGWPAEPAVEHSADAFEGEGDGPEMNKARQLLKEELLSILQRKPVESIRRDTRIVHFVGPTGVGKTTTIAKLAAEQVLKSRRSVGFITSDTYRIAAVEQLKTYANILNIPLEVVFSPQDLPKSFEKLGSCDVIFMDTAGRNFRNEMYVSELNSLLKTQEPYETYLVLSLSMKYNDMKAITNNFSKFGLDKVLFTKADETVTFGSVINLLHDFDLSLSYITDGQNVPDDIRPINVDKLADWLLEGRKE